MKVTLSAPVNHDGKVTTIAELAAHGLITFREVAKFGRKRGGVAPAYFADLPNGAGWEIGKVAYLSRTGHKISIANNP